MSDKIKVTLTAYNMGGECDERDFQAWHTYAWKSAFAKGNHNARLTDDPEVEWCEPATEAEAEMDLKVARLGGELFAAREALRRALGAAEAATRHAMQRAAILGRIEWTSRN